MSSRLGQSISKKDAKKMKDNTKESFYVNVRKELYKYII